MKEKWFFLSKGKIICLIVYYIILLLFGLCISSYILLNEDASISLLKSISSVALLGGISTSIIGSSMFYLRKIYKASINVEMEEPKNEKEKIREIGIISYYCLRPLFSIVFVLIIFITTKSSIRFVVLNEATLTKEFIYLIMIVSFFAGFASGDLITYIEEKSATIAKEAIKK